MFHLHHTVWVRVVGCEERAAHRLLIGFAMNKKLSVAMFAVTGLVPVAAHADLRSATITKMNASSATDTAPVTATNPPRLKRTDEEQPGNEMPKAVMFGDGKNGLYFVMSTDVNGVKPTRRMQLAAIPFSLQQAPDGSVSAVANMTGARFVTQNDGSPRSTARSSAPSTTGSPTAPTTPSATCSASTRPARR
jgi:hypothetical protein